MQERIKLGSDLPARLRVASDDKLREEAAHHIDLLEAWIRLASVQIGALLHLVSSKSSEE